MTISSRGSAERRQAMVEYLKQMSEIVSSDGNDPESVEAALSAIVTEIKGKEALIATDQKLSKVLERLIEKGCGNMAMIRTLWSQMTTVTLDIVYDQYGSHVLECLIKSTAEFDELDNEFLEILTRFSESIASDIMGVLSDPRATHVARQLATVLGGVTKLDPANLHQMEMSDQIKCLDQLQIVVESAFALPRMEVDTLITNPHSSMTLQILLIVAARRFPQLFESFLASFAHSEYLVNCLGDRVRSKFIECLTTAASSSHNPELLKRLLSLLFRSKPVAVLATLEGDEPIEEEGTKNPINLFEQMYAFGFMQSLVGSIQNDQIFTDYILEYFTFERITDCVARGGANGLGVIQRIADKLLVFPLKQTEFVQRLLMALGVTDKEKHKFALSRLLTMKVSYFGETEIIWDESFSDSELTPQGCLLMATLAMFKSSAIQCLISNCGPLVENLEHTQFVDTKWFTEVFAGRCLQNMISHKSGFPSGTRKKLIKIVLISQNTENLTKIALDKRVGSWLVTAAWDSCAGDVELKAKLGEGLMAIENLRENSWKIWKHCGLATFSRRKSEWTEVEKRKAKAHNLLGDIMADRNQYKKQKMN